MNPIRKTTRAAVLAAALALLVAAPTFAAESSGTMTLTVGSSISVSGVPTTIDFGSSLGDETVSAPQFTVSYSANTSASFDASATDLTATAGTIPVANLSASINGGASAAADGANVGTLGSGGGSGSATIDLSLAVPAAQAAGSYTGTFTVTGS